MDDPDRQTGGNYNYRVLVRKHGQWEPLAAIKFQKGPTKETLLNGDVRDVGLNGLTHEALLAIVLDRLERFQTGTFACEENAKAGKKIKEALKILGERVKDRVKRGVHDTRQK